MNVKYENSIISKLLQKIEASKGNVVLRSDVDDLGAERQISRALKTLVDKEILVKLGYGVYAKLGRSEYFDGPYLKGGGFVSVVREALDRLNIKWDLSHSEKDYNEYRTTQIPADPATKLLERFRRKLSYQGRELKIE